MSGKRETSPDADAALLRLAGETGAWLGELGVRPDDNRWIATHAETVASLFRAERRRIRWLYRLARRAARTAR